MRITSYKGCCECLTVACCSQVCAPYKRAVKKKYNLVIFIRKVSLDKTEKAVLAHLMLKDTHKQLSTVVYVKMHTDGIPYLQASYQPERVAGRIQIHLEV